MFAPNTNKQLTFDDSYNCLTERERKALDDSLGSLPTCNAARFQAGKLLANRQASRARGYVADSRQENRDMAAKKNIHLVTTRINGGTRCDIYAELEFNEDGMQVLKCPAGHAPKSCCYAKKDLPLPAVVSAVYPKPATSGG